MASYLLFVQHGWADMGPALENLSHRLTARTSAKASVLRLSYLQTWLRIEPLIQQVEAHARSRLSRYPDRPFRVIGHSMGGLIWLEVLHRNLHWWPRLESLVLLGSPVGGADLGRLIDPLGLGLGIAADLSRSRRPLAEAVAAACPTLVLAGDIDGGSDGTIPVGSTWVDGAYFRCLPGIAHAALRNHAQATVAIQQFWQGETALPWRSHPAIRQLQQMPELVETHPRGFPLSAEVAILADGSRLHTWNNPWGVLHVYVVSPQGVCLYSGFTGWLHTLTVQQLLERLTVEENAC